MESCLRILLLLFLVSGTLAQGFDLSDALDDLAPTPAKPKEKPKVPDNGDVELDLEGALVPDPTPKPTVKPPKSGGGGGGGGGGDGFDLEEALVPDPAPKPTVKPPKRGGGGGGGAFDDSDLFDVSKGGYTPEGGNSGGRAVDPGHDQGGADQPQEAGGGQIAAIVSAVGVALMGAASSYFAYQKKKLCFKIQGGQDPESGKGYQGTQSNPQSDPQVFSNLLRTS